MGRYFGVSEIRSGIGEREELDKYDKRRGYVRWVKDMDREKIF